MFAMMKKLCIIASLITLLSSTVIAAPNEALSVQTYMDYNKDNMFDPSTEVLSNVTVFLIKQTEDFSAVRALQTNNLGIADFSNVEKGTYTIDVCGNKMTHTIYTDDELGTLMLFNCLQAQVYLPIGTKQ